MPPTNNSQVKVRQYLLGQLTGDGLEQFEAELFGNDNLFQEVLVAEDELIDELIAGELNQNETELFAKFFLNSPERRRKLLFRRALKRYVDERNVSIPVRPQPWAWLNSLVRSFRPAVASAALVIIAALVMMPTVYHWITRPVTFATINLTMSGKERSPGSPIDKVKLPLTVDELRLQLALPESATTATSYRVELQLGSGEKRTLKILTRDDDEKSVVVALSASQLEPGQYVLNLYATKPGETEQRIAGGYHFNVE